MRKENADRLMMVLKLFCAMLIFNGDSRRHMRRIYRDVRKGEAHPEAREAGSRSLP